MTWKLGEGGQFWLLYRVTFCGIFGAKMWHLRWIQIWQRYSVTDSQAGLPDCNPWLQIWKICNLLTLFVILFSRSGLQMWICNPGQILFTIFVIIWKILSFFCFFLYIKYVIFVRTSHGILLFTSMTNYISSLLIVKTIILAFFNQKFSLSKKIPA